MGFTPDQVDLMGVWEFAACVKGYREAHQVKKKGGLDPDKISDDELKAIGIEGF